MRIDEPESSGPERERSFDRTNPERDTGAFAAALERHRQRLALWILVRMGPMLRSRTTVDDALQETFLQALRSRSSFRDDTGNGLFRWLTGIAENRLRDFAKYHGAGKRNPRREVSFSAQGSSSAAPEGFFPPDGGTPPLASASKRELHHLIATALETLAPVQREVIVQHVIEGQSFAALAERLGRSATSLHAIYGRALVELRRRLPVSSVG